MDSPVLNPEIPYVGEVPGGLFPGKMVKIQGSIPPDAVRFAINYQLGPNLNPRDDIALHLSPRFPEGFITRNHIKSMSWGPEENGGSMWIQPGQEFEIIILCEPLQYKIAVNGRHFTEFAHRLSYHKVTHLTIDGDVTIKSILFESLSSPPSKPPRVPDAPPVNIGPPGPGQLYPNIHPDQPQFPPAGGNWGPPPGPTPPMPGYGGNWQPGNPPQAYKQEEDDAFGSCLDKVGLAVGGLIAAGGVAAAMHAINKKKNESETDHEKSEHEKTHSSKTESEGGLNLGALGAALASGLASSALRGDSGLGHQQGYPTQDAGAGGMLGSLLGAFGGGGHQPAPQQPADPLGGALGSILGGVLGGGGHQPSGGYQSSGGYQPSGGYGGSQPQQGSGDFLSGIGGAIGSSLLSSALDGLTKNKSHGNDHPSSPPPPSYNYGPPRSDPPPQPAPRPHDSASSDGGKLTAADISKGLGLGDDDE